MNRRRWLIAGAALLALAAGGGQLLDHLLEREFRQPINDYLRDRTLALLSEQSPAGLNIALPHLDLSLLRRRLVLRDVRIRFDRSEAGRYLRFEATAPELLLTGLDLSDAIWQRNFRLSGVIIRSPRISRLETGPADTTAPPPLGADTIPGLFPAPDSVLYRVVATWLPDDVRGGRVERVSVERGTLVSAIRRGDLLTTDSTAELSLAIRGLQLDSARHRVFEWGTLSARALVHATPGRGDSLILEGPSITVAQEDTAVSIVQARTAPERPGHALRLYGLHRSQARRTLTIDSVSYMPSAPDAAFFASSGPRATRVRALARGVRAEGLDQDDVRRRAILPSVIRVGSLDLDVLADHRLPAPPRGGTARELWPSRLARLGWDAGADSLLLDSGTVRYAELTADARIPAVVTFEQVGAVITGASNVRGRDAGAGPMVLVGHARLFGQGELQARLAVPVRPGPLRVSASGRLGPMPFAPANRFLQPAQGIRITAGELRGASFHFEVRGGSADGELAAEYQGLDLELVDRTTGQQSLGKRLKSMVAGMLLRGSNLPDKRGRVSPGRIHYELEPDDTFWGVMWQAVRAGLLRTLRR